MGYFLGQRIPDYNPFWEEEGYKDEPDYWKWYHLGHQDGYPSDRIKTIENRIETLEEENSTLRELISANVRVIKAELRKEILESS